MRNGWKLSLETRRRISKGNARYWLGKHQSEETKEKIRVSLKGRKYPPRTAEHCRHLGEALKGRKRPDLSRALKGRTMPFEVREKLRKALKGRPSPLRGMKHSEQSRKNMSLAHIGFRHSEATRKKMKENNQGSGNGNWKGGITPLHKKIRGLPEYKKWRKSVFERDNYACVFCGVRDVPFHADHIKPFSRFPKLRFEVSNGRTLCVPCHKATPTYSGRAQSSLTATISA